MKQVGDEAADPLPVKDAVGASEAFDASQAVAEVAVSRGGADPALAIVAPVPNPVREQALEEKDVVVADLGRKDAVSGGVDRGKRPLEEVSDAAAIKPPPFDENVIDSDEEKSSYVDTDKESRDKKSRYTLKRLQRGEYPNFRVGDKWRCPFCNRMIRSDFNSVVMHAETLGVNHVKVGTTVHVPSFMAKHAAYGVFMRKLHAQDIEDGVVEPPKVKVKREKKKGQGSKRWRRPQKFL